MTEEQQEIARLVMLLLEHAKRAGETEFVNGIMLAIKASPGLRFLAPE